MRVRVRVRVTLTLTLTLTLTFTLTLALTLTLILTKLDGRTRRGLCPVLRGRQATATVFAWNKPVLYG